MELITTTGLHIPNKNKTLKPTNLVLQNKKETGLATSYGKENMDVTLENENKYNQHREREYSMYYHECFSRGQWAVPTNKMPWLHLKM